ncbi:hypothetical protein PLICRDRAFT_307442 [Plicaturopsis crispa FD-325 SS-3]|nr:hypothetical protein PLICRDRAFT_307442 [Plicaturopsis crispa FD-325 SS-3]
MQAPAKPSPKQADWYPYYPAVNFVSSQQYKVKVRNDVHWALEGSNSGSSRLFLLVTKIGTHQVLSARPLFWDDAASLVYLFFLSASSTCLLSLRLFPPKLRRNVKQGARLCWL